MAKAEWRGLRKGLNEFDWIKSSTLGEGEASFHRLSDFGEILVEKEGSGLEVIVRRICPGGERGETTRASEEREGVKAVAEFNLVESERLQLKDLCEDVFLYVFIDIGKLSQEHLDDWLIEKQTSTIFLKLSPKIDFRTFTGYSLGVKLTDPRSRLGRDLGIS